MSNISEMSFLLEIDPSFHCLSPDKELGPNNQLTSFKSEEVVSHLLKLAQCLRRGSMPRDGDVLSVRKVWFVLVSSFLLLACRNYVLPCWCQIKVLIHEGVSFSWMGYTVLSRLNLLTVLILQVFSRASQLCGTSQGSPAWYPSDGWRSPHTEDSFLEWACALRCTCTIEPA